MNKQRMLLPVMILFCAVIACNWSSDHKPVYAPTTSAVTPQAAALDNEAISAVKEFWEQHTTKCGPSDYGYEDNYPFQIMHQYTNISFVSQRTGPTTDADRLNGILWNGIVQIKTGAYREKPKGYEWSEWKQNQSLVDEIGATKRQSGWSIVQSLQITNMKKVKCSETEF